MPPASPLPLYDPLRWDFSEREHDIYDELRRAEPVHWAEHRGEWVITSHRRVKELLRDPAFGVLDHAGFVAGLAEAEHRLLPSTVTILRAALFFDTTPGHVAGRRYLARVLNDRSLPDYATVVERLVSEQIARLRRDGGGDLVADFARAVPYRFMAFLLGLPESDLPFISSNLDGILALTFNHTAQLSDFVQAEGPSGRLLDYLTPAIASRRDAPRADGISRMLAEAGPEGEDDRKMAARIVFLFLVGVETTVTLLAKSMVTLLARPEEASRWREGQVGADTAVNELLRYESPIAYVYRRAQSSLEWAGRPVQSGHRLAAVLAAANRDPEVFPHPHALDLGRRGAPPLSFGEGAHSCLGGALARMEASLALPAFLRLPPIRTAGVQPVVRLEFLTVWRGFPITFA